MKVVIQRVSKASVKVENKIISSIDNGLCILLGVTNKDTNIDVDYLVNKIINLRIFNDLSNKMNLSVKDVQGEILLVSQFTLCANTKRGRRPSFKSAALPINAKKLYVAFEKKLIENNLLVNKGLFGQNMHVNIINNGPVTIIIDSKVNNE